MKPNSEIAILYLSKHFRKKITLDEIAKISGVSPFHFHRKFVAENNCTPHAYLENIRMQNASHIMTLFPKLSLTSVAFECGYSSPGIFSRAFKKYFGLSPSKYRTNSVDKPERIGTVKTKPIQIQYLPKKTLVVQKVPLIERKLNFAYQKLIDSISSNTTLFGIFFDVPFHVPLEQCRYFIGIESEVHTKDSSVLSIDSGYYTSIILHGGFDHLKEKLVALNAQIQNKGFVIDSLIGLEKIHIPKKSIPFDYMESTREIFVKIRHE